jgi:hypothetical protein
MRIIEVNNRLTLKLFHNLPREIYKGDQNFACPLYRMVEETFEEKTNSFFKHGKAIRWIVLNEKNRPIGRIAAFLDFNKAHLFDQPTGNIGFYECIDNKEVAFLLFDTARNWLKSQGMEAMDGPANLGENYMNHGLLVNGFTLQGFGMPYNLPYYLHQFESYGFKLYYEQYSYHLDLRKEFPERFWKIAEWVNNKPQYSFRHIEWEQIDQFVDDFAEVYSAAWSKHEHYKPLDRDELFNFIHSSKLLLDKEFIWFAYANNEPIAVFVMLPDFNQALRYLKNGKLNLWNYYSLLKNKNSPVHALF